MIDLFRQRLASLILAGGLCAAAAPALAQPYFINFTGSDTNGGLLTGTATVSQQGSDVSALAFTATFTNLLQEGAGVNTATFTLADLADVTFFTAANPNGTGATTFSFDLSGTENTLTGFSTYYDAEFLTNADYSWTNDFTTQVTQFTVPEPANAMILGLGLLACARLRRKHQA